MMNTAPLSRNLTDNTDVFDFEEKLNALAQRGDDGKTIQCN